MTPKSMQNNFARTTDHGYIFFKMGLKTKNPLGCEN